MTFFLNPQVFISDASIDLKAATFTPQLSASTSLEGIDEPAVVVVGGVRNGGGR